MSEDEALLDTGFGARKSYVSEALHAVSQASGNGKAISQER